MRGSSRSTSRFMPNEGKCYSTRFASIFRANGPLALGCGGATANKQYLPVGRAANEDLLIRDMGTDQKGAFDAKLKR